MYTCACVQNVQILLPEDVVCTYDLGADESCCSRPLTRSCCTPDAPCIPEDASGADIGPKSVSRFVDALQECKCIFWNGPMGKFELPAYANGTEELALAMAAMTKAGATTIIGGATYSPPVPARSCVCPPAHLYTIVACGVSSCCAHNVPLLSLRKVARA